MAKKTQLELLQEIADLLTPVSNLAKFEISKINQAMQEQQALAQLRHTTTAAAEMKKAEENAEG